MTTRRTLEKNIKPHLDLILQGTVLAWDPSSGGRGSNPGWAWYSAGKLETSGVIELDDKLPAPTRLRELLSVILADDEQPDILVVEQLRGKMVPAPLHWSVGVLLAGYSPQHTFEMPISTWKTYARQCDEYEKTDEMDAIAIGLSLIEIAKELKGETE